MVDFHQSLAGTVQAGRRPPQPLTQPVQPLSSPVQHVIERDRQPFGEVVQLTQALFTRGRTQLCRRRRCGRPEIGSKVAQGEIGLVTDPTDDRHRSTGDRANHLLVIEGPKILQRTTPPYQQQHVDVALDPVPLVGCFERQHQLLGSTGTLHRRREQKHRQMGHPSGQGRDHIAQGRCAQGGHQAQRAWLAGQRTLTLRIKKTFGFQTRLQTQKLFEQTALTGHAQGIDDQLQIAPRAIDIQTTTRLHQVTVPGRERQLVG
jgi:hypothetical protein